MWSCCWKEYQAATEINFFVSFVLQFAASMLESKVQLAPPTKNVIMAVLTPESVIQLTAFIAFETGRKLNSVCCILLLVPLQTYIWQKKNWALLTDLLKVKNNMFLPDNGHTQKRRYSVNTHPWTSIGCFSWQLEYGYSPLQIYFKKDC